MFDEIYYVYGHYDENGDLRYVGKGKENRAYIFRDRAHRWKVTFPDGYPAKVEFFKKNLTEQEAFKLEIYLIEKYRRESDLLVNEKVGGAGYSHREETKAKISLTKRTRPGSAAKPWLGKKRDPAPDVSLVARKYLNLGFARSPSTASPALPTEP